MANIPTYDGNPIWDPSKTPFGFYDSDPTFQADALKVARFVASRLGYPVMEVELQDGSIFTAFEEAITTYGNELYSYKIRDNQLSLEGMDVNSSPLNDVVINPTFNPIVSLTKQYGAEAGSGGNVTYHEGYINTITDQQTYNLKTWMDENNITGPIEIKRVFYEAPSALSQYMDPYLGTSRGLPSMVSSFGFGGMSPLTSHLMVPLSHDVQFIQSIEMNHHVKKTHYSFELRNHDLKIFPIPNSEYQIKIEYIIVPERIESGLNRDSNGNLVTDKVSNVSNSPYVNPTYSTINSVGKSWIFEYTLALSKEILGLIRGKYTSIPIPNAEVNLNQSDLLNQAQDEKNKLIDRLREYLDETSRKSLLERRSQEAEFKNDELKNVPFTIYVG